MALIFTIDGGRPGPVHLAVDQGDDVAFALLIECREGYYLTAAPDGDDVAIEGRQDVGDAWADIVADPLDLTPFAGNLTEFNFRLTADADAAIGPADAQRIPRIRVTKTP